MKILITGAGGFIGSNLTERCVELGYDVKAFVHYNSNNFRGWLETSKYKNDIEFVSGDVRDYDSVYKAMSGCEVVFHLAALIGIPYSYLSPLAYIKTNIEGTYNILEAGKNLNLEQILVTSTSETYGTAQYVPIDEMHPAVGQSPYSASKIAADQIAVSYYKSFGTPVKIVRPFNTFGPRQSARAIIPTIVSQIVSGAKSIKVGNLHPTRDLTYVKDTAEGFLKIFKCDKFFGEALNIGMGFEISIGDLIKKIISLTNNVEIISDDTRIRPAESEVERLFCNNKKLIENTDWNPAYTLENGLKETIEFIKANIDKYKVNEYVV